MKVPPLPIAALLLRARNAKSAKERHDLAYFGWEASVRLAVAARPPEDRARLAMPSTGDWTAVFVAGAGDRILDEPALLAVQQQVFENCLTFTAGPLINWMFIFINAKIPQAVNG